MPQASTKTGETNRVVGIRIQEMVQYICLGRTFDTELKHDGRRKAHLQFFCKAAIVAQYHGSTCFVVRILCPTRLLLLYMCKFNLLRGVFSAQQDTKIISRWNV